MRTRPLLLLLLLLLPVPAPARDKPENWIEVRSQHFTVVTPANEKTARRIADQFERMRSVFHLTFPNIPIDNFAPIVVFAVKDDKDFRALEAKSYLAKGQVKLAGLFLRAPEKNYVLMRVDAEGDHPYSVIYHEYTHLLTSRTAEWMPLWLNEGLAEYYQTTEIHENSIALGKPSHENLALLRESSLLPLSTLFTVDDNSPYYHEENRASIFYAESWALTHYIQVNDIKNKTQRLTDYLQLVAQKVDPVTAATRAFGDLLRQSGTLYLLRGCGEHHGRRLRFQSPALDRSPGRCSPRRLPRLQPAHRRCPRSSRPCPAGRSQQCAGSRNHGLHRLSRRRSRRSVQMV